jgi:glycosyltransferase involved in cell wall biosynthesis
MTPPLRVAMVTTHPIQYQVPWFRALAQRPEVDLTVFYAHLPSAREQGTGFGVSFVWDLPLLDGYRHVRLHNVASQPALSTFRGSDTPEIGRALEAGGFDAVIVNGWHTKSGLQTLLACRRQRRPCIVRGDSNALKARPWYVRLLHRAWLAQYDGFLTVGRSNADFYRRGGVPQRKLFPGPHCVDNARFGSQASALAPDRGSLRAAFGIDSDACTFLFCGKLIGKKRPGDALEGLQRALRSGLTRAHLLVVGDGELRAACEQRARADALPVTFAGFLNQTEITRAYVAADALVLPSDYGETWGLVVNEAMACARPAFVSERVGCHPDLVVSDVTGAVFPFGDVDALAASWRRAAAEPALLAEMGTRAQRHIAAYSIDALVAGTLQALRYVVGRSRRTALTERASVQGL